MNDQDREVWIETKACALWEELRQFRPQDRMFVIAEVMNRLVRKLKNRESTRYHLDFTQDEPPTKPGTE